ncbi:tRNA-specific 2-thiouridylase MnmA [bioreactor metagenome]|uniref:tRNA-specific 2-thiouridylase MnmA n=3 Tax=root TaxID=1 RepID=A0ABY4DG97_9SPIR|nr:MULTISPECIES: tRNA 2-thiouridine(34) synthase MnmA [Sphaerochaeta]MDT3358359.1 tRNA 2-thiouridine(34) synthase MnmA [Spirochaetota bacterium]MDD3424007.1 tRNA 2-thiouridine(34) synthase MnmA [Sphaerochaeta sp.]MDD4450898.1 tRNA 2-thiouridine(34) synthase MnmA [Sphaerochaeta sp.]MDX9985023.1 tRNA 2-thiouridine(34) synthase MnmA [Sphaerochaeta sp.]MEA5027370.1 tRNA 2-thiouridine(34) synthase MnmA [Sphaerochaeta associata]
MKVLVGMSGGIDSSVAAYLLKQQGHEVMGVTMTIWNKRSHLSRPLNSTSCFAPDKTEDIRAIKKICEKIGIEHQVLELSDLFEEIVLSNFKAEYMDGRTPNPCVWCNAKIKFGAMVEYAMQSGLVFDRFATGHYARIVEQNGRYAVAKAVDLKKDQSYFLYRLNQEQLARTLFPLGGMTKEDVRKIDVAQGFHKVYQEESQDFYDGDYTDLLDISARQGNIVTKQGEVLGRHEGIWHYTIGQRKGLGIAAPRPLYVLELRADTNEVVVGFVEDTLQSTVTASDVVWSKVSSLEGEVVVQAKIRSTGYATEAKARQNDDGTITAIFSDEVKAATVGQSLVLYDGSTILCGGIIVQAC